MAQADPARRTHSRSATTETAGNGKAPAATKATARRRSADTNGGPRPEPTLRILETRVLRGPNYWAREPVIRQVVDLGVLEEFPSNKIPGFVDALVEMLPTLEDHACSLGRRGGFITRLREGTWVGHVAEHIALEFQNLAGTDVRHGKTRGTGEYGRYNVIFEYREEQVGIEACPVEQAHGLGGDQRRLLGGLGDHPIAGCERGGDLAGEDRYREVPG